MNTVKFTRFSTPKEITLNIQYLQLAFTFIFTIWWIFWPIFLNICVIYHHFRVRIGFLISLSKTEIRIHRQFLRSEMWHLRHLWHLMSWEISEIAVHDEWIKLEIFHPCRLSFKWWFHSRSVCQLAVWGHFGHGGAGEASAEITLQILIWIPRSSRSHHFDAFFDDFSLDIFVVNQSRTNLARNGASINLRANTTWKYRLFILADSISHFLEMSIWLD